MSRKPIATAFALTLMLAAAGCQSASNPPLIVYLRCHEGATGSVSVMRISGSGESRGENSFDVENACTAGKVELQGYQSSQALRFKLGRTDGKVSELTSSYGANIQRDQNRFFVVVKITDTPPFLTNDRI